MALRAAAVMTLVFACLGCDRSVSPPPTAEASPRDASAAVVPEAPPDGRAEQAGRGHAEVEARVDRAQAGPDLAVDRPAGQPVAVPEATPPADVRRAPTEEVVGEGRCKTDDDCVLSTWQSGCCVQACQAHAIDRRTLAARQAKENCATDSPEVCPPPSPCPPRTHEVLAARCSRRACVSVQRKLP